MRSITVLNTARVYEHIAMFLKSFETEGERVLEIGCGGKQYAECAGNSYWGLDLRNDKYPGDSPDVLADAHHIPVSDNSIHLVFVVAALHQMQDPVMVMKEVHRVLMPRGRFVIFDYASWVCRRLGAPHVLSSRILCTKLRELDFDASIHRDCVPIKGPRCCRVLWSLRIWRILFYFISNWIVVSGSKRASAGRAMADTRTSPSATCNFSSIDVDQ